MKEATVRLLVWVVGIVMATTITENTVGLKWTAPGDDGDGPPGSRAEQYAIRFSASLITAANFDAAMLWTSAPRPGIAGTMDSTTVGGLVPSTTYWFALKAVDDAGNWSGISNVVAVTTAAAPNVPAPEPITDLRGGP